MLYVYPSAHSLPHCVVKTKEPVHLAKRFGIEEDRQSEVRATRRQHHIRVEFNLSIARSGFVYRGAQLWNMIPVDIKTAMSIKVFKKLVKPWIKSNIGMYPNN